MYIVKIIRVFESGSNVFWIHPTIHCYWCDKILKYLGCFYLELLARWWFYVLRYSRLLQNMQIKWSKPSSREKGWFPRTSYSTSATRNPQQISKARHLLSLLLAANTTGVKRRECLFLQRLDDFVGHAFGYSTQSLKLLSAVFDPLDLISTVCCSQIGPKKTTLIQDKGKLFKQHRPFPSYFHFFKDLCFFSWQLGQWLFKCTVFFFIGNYHFFLDGNVAGYLFCSCSIWFVAKGCKYLPNIPGIELFNSHQLANFSEMPKKKFNIIEARWDICIS